MPYLPKAKRGMESKLPMYYIVNAILYKLKTGVQWRFLPVSALFPHHDYSWKSVYHHFNKWSKNQAWDKLHQHLLANHRKELDMSSIQIDGSHTPVKRGGQSVGYQGRKKSKTSNLLLLTDTQGIPLACSAVISGQHNDAFDLECQMESMLNHLKKSGLNTTGLFLNADAGFDTKEFKKYCISSDVFPNIAINRRNGASENDNLSFIFDELLYKSRFVIERTNAWLDAFKALLVRFETSNSNWRAWNVIASCLILLRYTKL